MSEKKDRISMEELNEKYKNLFPPGYVDAWANDDIMEIAIKVRMEREKKLEAEGEKDT